MKRIKLFGIKILLKSRKSKIKKYLIEEEYDDINPDNYIDLIINHYKYYGIDIDDLKDIINIIK